MTSPSSTPPDGPPPTLDFGGEEQAEQLVRILDQYLADLKAGRPTDRATLLAAHPELAQQLGACLAGLEFIQGVESTGPGAKADLASVGRRTLGDFRIVREVGRGGMGAVYEAEQISLGRRVALKVLRFGGASDPEALDRFQREAETVARLHHTNIVPIFAVGAEQGVNFYAMQFIEGQSLAEVAAGARGPLDADDVTSWGLQAAEALTHAHDRNVIHRDVKPSNLLLDQERRIWLTDFGLARRLDDVTLSMTGALLGTPRYMSPEQASATRRQVDRRTDIYSLGATLYELLAGRPAFSGDTPHHVIQQILSTEPIPLRQVRPDVSRDLETVVMKCLSKEPDRRYGSARDLTDDLRACLERRPIKARRAGPVELAARWLRTQRQGVRITTYAVAATLVLVVTLFAGARWYDHWRTATLSLATSTPPLTAELRNEDGGLATAASIPTEQPLTLRDGQYDLRLSNLSQWSQTFRTHLDRGQSIKWKVDLDDQQLWMPTTTQRGWSLVDDAAGAALLLWSDEGVECVGGAPQRTRWKTQIKAGATSALAEAPGLQWPWAMTHGGGSFVTGPTDRAPVVAVRTVDVNGDGSGDFLVAARHQAFLLALSGRDGSILWCAARGADVQAPRPAGERADQRMVRSALVGPPHATADQDGDGVPDLLVTGFDAGAEFRRHSAQELRDDLLAERWVELVSGASGRTIWKRPLADAWFAVDDGRGVPDGFQSMVGTSFGYSSGMIGGDLTLRRQYIRHGRQRIQRNGQHVYAPEPARVIDIGGESRMVAVAGGHLVELNASTGHIERDDAFNAVPARPGRWADLDGDGAQEFVFVERAPPASITPGVMTVDATRIVAWSATRRQRLWTAELAAHFPWREAWTIALPDWPLLADLDGDGAAEVISPDDSSQVSSAKSFVEVPWGEIAVRDGRTGEVRWRQRVVVAGQQMDRLAVGPDVDGDGVREVFSASLANLPMKLHVEARSGQTGELVWLTSHSMRGDSSHSDRHVNSLVWWNAGEDGWPQLVVSVHNEQLSPMESEAIIVSSRDGRTTRKRRQTFEVASRDVDHDGVEDLVTYRPHDLAHPEDGGEIDCVRGMASAPWNRLGEVGRPAADFNGDGVRDFLVTMGADSAQASCGRTGRRLWTWSAGNHYSYRVQALTEPGGGLDDGSNSRGPEAWADVDGDGTTDVLYWLPHHFGAAPTALLGVLSGRTGEVLWRTNELPVLISDGLRGFRWVDVDGDGVGELAILAVADIDYPTSRLAKSSDEYQAWLLVLSARSGKVRWRAPLSPAFGPAAPVSAQLPPAGTNSSVLRTQNPFLQMIACGDLDGDRLPDILTPALAPAGNRLELQAFRGQDGAPLWRHSLAPDSDTNYLLDRQHAPQIADVDGDGRSEALILERVTPDPAAPASAMAPQLCILDGADGKVRWRHDGPHMTPYAAEGVPGERRISDLVLLRLPEGRLAPTFLCSLDKPQLILAPGGAERRVVTLREPRSTGRLWRCDVEGDGVDELAFVHERQVRLMTSTDLERPRWTFGSPESPIERILEVRSGPDGKAVEIVALRPLGDGSVVGLDAATGRERWVCAGPIPRDRRNLIIPEAIERLDVGREENSRPLISFQYNAVTHVRGAALRSLEREAARETERVSSSVSSVVAQVGAPGGKADRATFAPASRVDDPRWGRNLPWVMYSGSSLEMPRFLWQSWLFAVALIIMPFEYVVWLVRRRQWSLRMLLAAPALVGLTILVSTTSGFGAGETTVGQRWFLGLAAAPPLVFLARLAVWPCRGQWRRAFVWVAVVVGASALLGGIQLASDLATRSLEPGEFYVFDDWYFIFDYGFYVTALLALPVVAIDDWRRRRRTKGVTDAALRAAA